MLKIYRRKGGKIWHYRGTVDGRRLRGSCKTTDKAVAQRVAHEKEQKQWKRRIDGPSSVLTFAQAATLYLDAQKSSRFVALVAAHWKNETVGNITAGAIRASCATLLPNAGAATWNRQVITVTQAIINHAAELELCQRIRVRRYPVTRTEKTPATWTWVKAFMSASSPHLGALACFMFSTGARISEALSLNWTEIDFGLRQSLVRQTKTGSERRAHLPPPLVAALANIPEKREGRVFGYESDATVRRHWKLACKRAGIPVLLTHSCRHGFATSLLHAGVDVVTVAKLGGWASAKQVIGTYGHAMEDPTITDILTKTGADLTQENLERAKRA